MDQIISCEQIEKIINKKRDKLIKILLLIAIDKLIEETLTEMHFKENPL